MKYEVWENLAHKYNNLWVQKYSLGPTRREVLKIVNPLLEKNKSLKNRAISAITALCQYKITQKYYII